MINAGAKLIILSMFGALGGKAQTITCTFQFTGSGTIGTQGFTSAAITITTVGNTAKRQPNGQAGYYIVDDSASILISGVGTFQFTVPIFTYVATPGDNAPGTGNTFFGLGDARENNFSTNAGIVNVLLSGFNPWNMLDSVGPLTAGGAVVDWNLSPITTGGGVVNLYGGYPSITFHAMISSPPTSVCPIDPPTISSVNSATDFGGFSHFASGSYLEVRGSNLAVDARQWAASDFNGSEAPNSLDGSKVSINATLGYVSYISSTQINVQAPADSATGLVQIVVTNCAGNSAPFMFQKNTLAPGMLAPESFYTGKQYLVALFADDLAQGLIVYVGNKGLIAGANFRPAKPGDLIIVYGLGFGAVAPATPPGVVASGSTNLLGVSVSFGQIPATLSYAGLYPGFVGLFEFYVTVPVAADGDYPINISLNGMEVQQTLFLTVKQ